MSQAYTVQFIFYVYNIVEDLYQLELRNIITSGLPCDETPHRPHWPVVLEAELPFPVRKTATSAWGDSVQSSAVVAMLVPVVFTGGVVICCRCGRCVYSSAVLEDELPFPVTKTLRRWHGETATILLQLPPCSNRLFLLPVWWSAADAVDASTRQRF